MFYNKAVISCKFWDTPCVNDLLKPLGYILVPAIQDDISIQGVIVILNEPSELDCTGSTEETGSNLSQVG